MALQITSCIRTAHMHLTCSVFQIPCLCHKVQLLFFVFPASFPKPMGNILYEDFVQYGLAAIKDEAANQDRLSNPSPTTVRVSVSR